MATTVQTVLGEMKIEDLGFTLMHEHVLSAGPGIARVFPELINDGYPELTGTGYKNRILSAMNAAKAGGIDTILDMTPYDLGRDAGLLREISKQSGINIIASTGWFHEPDKVVSCLGKYPAERFAEVFIRELTVGMEGTNIRAQVIKTSMDHDGCTPGRETIHRACAIAGIETGAPIILHQHSEKKTAYDQLRILREEGADLRRVKVEHLLDTDDEDYVRWVGDQGVWMGLDRLPDWRIPGNRSNNERIRSIKTIIDMGFADRILFGHDSAVLSMNADSWPPNEAGRNAADNPHGLCYLRKVTMPALLKLGVEQAILNEIVNENPKRFFSGE